MKKIIITIILIIIIIPLTIFLTKDNKKNNGIKVKVAEVAHSIFYAPQYLAISEGYFKEEGLDIDLILTPGADAVMASVLSGDVDIGFSGTEATIYVYNGDENDYPKVFAGLTKRDGSFLVSRNKDEIFNINNLKNKKVIGGRKGGMPEMTFEWALRENNIDPNKDLDIDTSIAFPAMQGAFISGIGDYVTLFEPNATNIEKQGTGKIVAYIGTLGGEVPYTAYYAKKSYIKDNENVINKFTKAINKGLLYVKENEPIDIAVKIKDFFPDTNINDLTKMIERYKNGDAWKDNTSINKDEWKHIQDIMIASNELDKYIEYKELIYDKYFK